MPTGPIGAMGGAARPLATCRSGMMDPHHRHDAAGQQRGMDRASLARYPPGSVVVAVRPHRRRATSAAHGRLGSPSGMYGKRPDRSQQPDERGDARRCMRAVRAAAARLPIASTRAGPRRNPGSAAIAHADAGRWRDGG